MKESTETLPRMAKDTLASITIRERDEAGGLNERIARYSIARERALVMRDYLQGQRSDLQKEIARLELCGNYLVFHHYYTEGLIRLAGLRSCKQHLLCPLCAIRRGAKALKAYLDKYKTLKAADVLLTPYLVTFTVKNGEDLLRTFQHLQGAYKKLLNRRRHWFKGTRGARWTEAVKARGAVWSYEVTNKGKGWHPHLHAIWLSHEAPDKQALRAEWEAITKDSFMVDVRPIDRADPAEGFCEVFKYFTKFSELSPEHNVEVYETFKGKRLLDSFGCFRGVKVPDELTDELLDDLPYIELFYRFIRGSGYNMFNLIPSQS